MRWMRVSLAGTTRTAYATDDGRLQLIDAGSIDAVINGEAWHDDGVPLDLKGVKVLAPANPSKIICIGLNYRDHCRETGNPEPTIPVLFAKFGNTVAAHGDAISWPAGSTEKVDFEAELGVVIGKRAKGVDVQSALDHVFGYVVVNDVSARDIQNGDGQWVRGKSLDGFCPFGPELVTKDEVADVQNLRISCLVNGVTLQDSNTREMIFPVAELISFISATTTLDPGDLVITGTPHGVGVGRTPQVFLAKDDIVEVRIETLGVLTNRILGPVAPGFSGSDNVRRSA